MNTPIPMYLGWFEDNKRKTVEQRIAEGCATFASRFGREPQVVQMSDEDSKKLAGPVGKLTVEVPGYVRSNNYWLGPV